MKKTRFLVLALAVAVMLMGAGYAWWSETLTVETTVNTGKLDFDFRNASVTTSDNIESENGEYSDGSQKITGIDWNKLEINLNRMYPGATFEVEFDIVNTGTMPLQVRNLDFIKYDSRANYVKIVEVDGLPMGENGIAITELDKFLPAGLAQIEAGETKPCQILFQIDPNAKENQIPESGQFSFTLFANVHQFNEPVPGQDQEPAV